jgi:hypothetical protein
MLEGKVPTDVVPYIYGAKLVALKKKDGGIRPIAVGSVFRRITSKLCVTAHKRKIAENLLPFQYGFGTRLGCEAVAHGARKFCSLNKTEDYVFLKVDFKNAFNSLRREVFLKEVKTQIPDILPYVLQCYGSQTNLMYNTHVIPSLEGVQQGDPLGPLLFCIAINDHIKKLESNLNAWYLDDGSLGGDANIVIEDLLRIRAMKEKLGLELNDAKCELLVSSEDPTKIEDIINRFKQIAPEIKILTRKELTLLGTPICSEAIDEALSVKLITFNRLCKNLHMVDTHDAFFLLKNCLAIPKMMYTLRTAPCFTSQTLLTIDKCIHDTLAAILNVNLEDNAWDQASLPISFGGLGIRKTVQLSVSAFAASATGASALINTILQNCNIKEDHVLQNAIATWKENTGDCDIPNERCSQHVWDNEICNQHLKKVYSTMINDKDRARIKAVTTKEAGHWLNAYPIQKFGLKLDDNQILIAIAIRIGAKVCIAHKCIFGADVNQDGTHGLEEREDT